MKIKSIVMFLALAWLGITTFNFQVSTASAQGTAFAYQGRLNDGTNPANGVYDLQFTIYDSTNIPGTVIAGPLTNPATGVSNGFFTVTMDFGGGVFTGPDRWLDVGVRTNGGGSFLALMPRQRLTPTPYAMFAGGAASLQSGGITGFRIMAQSPGGSYSNVVNVAGGYPGNVASGEAATVAGGGALISGFPFPNIVVADFGTIGGGASNLVISGFGTIAGGYFNYATGLQGATVGGGFGNAATGTFATIGGGEHHVASGSGAFIGGGGTDGNMIAGNTAGGGVSVVAGGLNNAAGGYAATVGGGTDNNNGGDHAVVGGGGGNIIQPTLISATISGGYHNTIQGNANFSTVGGGTTNIIQMGAVGATISGGLSNIAGSYGDTISGGERNFTSAAYATVGGGFKNQAINLYATVPGGENNIAGGFYSFAAGQQAQALHQGSFVWADSQNAVFASTTNDQFCIRAQGGVGINKNNPASTLDVNGTSRIQGANNWDVNNSEGDFRVGNDSYRFKIGVATSGGGTGDVWMRAHGGTGRVFLKTPGGTTIYSNEGQTTGVSLAAGGGAWASLSDRNAKENFIAVDAREILRRVAALPLSTWNYKSQEKSIRHIGPMAQDFASAFQVGEDERHITTIDADGVALAAIQGLDQMMETEKAGLREELKRRDAENAELKRRLDILEKIILNKKSN